MTNTNPRDKMLFSNDAQPGSLAHAMRLQSTLSVMDDTVRGYIYEQLREAEAELHVQQAASRQLESDLQTHLHRDHKNGTTSSPLYRLLPPELRSHIYSYVVRSEPSIHIFPPKGNETHGYRLSICDESSYDFDLGHCRCDDSRTRTNTIVTSTFFHNALFLVSRSVRREALDAFFLVNRFTFTCLYELVRFTSSFKASSSKIQDIRIFERVDDYPNSEFRVKGIQKARARLRALKGLEIYVFLSSWSAYETLHEDGLVDQLVHFALGPPPPPPMPPIGVSDAVGRVKKRKSIDADGELSFDDSARKAARTVGGATLSGSTEGAEMITSTTTTTTTSTSTINQEQQVPSLTSSPTTSEISLSSLPDSRRYEHFDTLLDAYNAGATRLSGPTDIPEKRPPAPAPAPALPPPSSPPHEKPPAFSIPPLKFFKANVRLRNLQLSLRNRPDNGKQEYYAGLYTRLTDHLTDVFLDHGKKYRVIEDVPSLGPKPKLKVRDDERALTGVEKRGILYLKD